MPVFFFVFFYYELLKALWCILSSASMNAAVWCLLRGMLMAVLFAPPCRCVRSLVDPRSGMCGRAWLAGDWLPAGGLTASCAAPGQVIVYPVATWMILAIRQRRGLADVQLCCDWPSSAVSFLPRWGGPLGRPLCVYCRGWTSPVSVSFRMIGGDGNLSQLTSQVQCC